MGEEETLKMYAKKYSRSNLTALDQATMEESSERLFRRIHVDDVTVKYACGAILIGNFRHSRRSGHCHISLNKVFDLTNNYLEGWRTAEGKALYLHGEEKIAYWGEYSKDYRHGYGEVACPTWTATGMWVVDTLSAGQFTTSSLDCTGEWAEGVLHGEGVYRERGGRTVRGRFDRGKWVGEAEVLVGGVVVVGRVREDGGIAEGGRIVTRETTYEGQVKGDKPHGSGKMIWLVTGEEYSGDWRDGEITGIGVLHRADGSSYTGQFLKGEYFGKGELHQKDGSLLVGSFKNNFLEGDGEQKYSPTDSLGREIYRGQFWLNQPQGKGTLLFRSGTEYTGEFHEGKISGRGRMIIASEKTELSNKEYYDGNFADGLFDGRIVL
jgi:hypothetical protein